MQLNYKSILIICLLCLLPLLATAQQTYNMGGTVYDESGETLPGVSIFLKAQAMLVQQPISTENLKSRLLRAMCLYFHI